MDVPNGDDLEAIEDGVPVLDLQGLLHDDEAVWFYKVGISEQKAADGRAY